jgi:hypothetical protein
MPSTPKAMNMILNSAKKKKKKKKSEGLEQVLPQ